MWPLNGLVYYSSVEDIIVLLNKIKIIQIIKGLQYYYTLHVLNSFEFLISNNLCTWTQITK